MVQGKLKVNQSSPDLTCLQMLTHTVCSSLYYLLRFLLIAALYVMILDCGADGALVLNGERVRVAVGCP